ncbi:MAG: hypothetical protein O3A01_01850 [bacterium]|nr:hypothetical protein [bacterium]
MGFIEYSAGAKGGRDAVYKAFAAQEDEFYTIYDKVIANLRALKEQKSVSILVNELRKFSADITKLVERFFYPAMLELERNMDANIKQQVKDYKPKLERIALAFKLTIIPKSSTNKRTQVMRGQGDKILPYVNEFIYEANPLVEVLGVSESAKPTVQAEQVAMQLRQSGINIQQITPPE